MRSWRVIALLVVLVLPGVAAQVGPTGNNASAPSPSTGNNGSPVGPTESVESQPGVVYGLLVLAGILAFVGVLGYVSTRWRQRR